ncbi:hypothetical protein [Legionella gresilensis]|uniref:hypothetical protein n=1 Tax=Legionella gresilensis TaxID=91823 RepID=UPI0013EFB603|nr:hypothetical protein [Legionella gresilensis]
MNTARFNASFADYYLRRSVTPDLAEAILRQASHTLFFKPVVAVHPHKENLEMNPIMRS